MFSRRIVTTLPRASRSFHVTARAMVKTGDSLPNIDLVEGSPGNKVNLSKELTGKGVIIGVPAAFSEELPFSLYDGYRSFPN
jgi:2-Cys peroxiredoxin 5